MTKQNEFFDAIENNNVKQVALLLKEKNVDPSFESNLSIRSAAYDGSFEIIKLLLNDKRVNPSDNNNDALIYASENGDLETVKLLIKDNRVDPSGDNNKAIQSAHLDKKYNVVSFLWNNEIVKNKLKNDNLDLHNELIKQDIKDKVAGF